MRTGRPAAPARPDATITLTITPAEVLEVPFVVVDALSAGGFEELQHGRLERGNIARKMEEVENDVRQGMVAH